MTPPVTKSHKKPLTELEQECKTAHKYGLIEEYSYNPHLSRPYLFIRFHKTTEHQTKVQIAEYIRMTYQVYEVEFVSDGTALYVVYDFWSRFHNDEEPYESD